MKNSLFSTNLLCVVVETLSESEELLFGSQSLSPKKFSNAIVSPAKNNHKEETEDEEGDQSSYDGSCHSDSELSGICELDEERYVGVNYVRLCIEECFKAYYNVFIIQNYSCSNMLWLSEIEFHSRERNFVFNDLLLLFVRCNILYTEK